MIGHNHTVARIAPATEVPSSCPDRSCSVGANPLGSRLASIAAPEPLSGERFWCTLEVAPSPRPHELATGARNHHAL